MKTKIILFILSLIKFSFSFGQPYLNWTNSFTNPAKNNMAGNDLVLQDTFTIIAGTRDDGVNSYLLIVKLNNHGDTIWSQKFKNYEKPTGVGDGTQIILADLSGNIYTVGTFKFSSDDYLLIKCNSSGDTIWTRRFDGSAKSWDYAKAISFDKKGNIIITGVGHVGGINGDCVTIKYDSNGNMIWTKIFDSGNTSWDDYGHKIAVDDSNNIFIAGDFGLIKYDSEGKLKWSKVNSTFVQIQGEGANVKIDRQQNIIYSTRNLNNKISKFDQQGNLIAYNNFSPLGYTESRIFCLTVDNNNNIIVSGWSGNAGGNADVIIVKYNPSLKQIWQKEFKKTGGIAPNYITSDLTNNIYVIGTSFLLLKYDSSGLLLWDTLQNSSFSANKIVLDAINNVYMTGYSQSTKQGILTIKYSPVPLLASVENQFYQTNNQIEIFPNPTNGNFFISFPIDMREIHISNSIGEIIQTRIIDGETALNFEIANSGIYFITMVNDKNRFQKKLMVR